ncbi:MAG: DegT/DnrJ/EryC1/StrS family aminotransferase [Myxococcales bacterium]|nr:DegT/DnrJ/EryC1/StrS family aminotransferase [Myxococcales bacterium]
MRVPFFDLGRLVEEQRAEIDAAVGAVLAGGCFILGPQLRRFESELGAALLGKAGSGQVVGCNSGTDAIALSLLALGIGAGDEVITVSHTAVPTASAIRSVGATPVYLDIKEDTWLMDPRCLEAALTLRTRAVVPVHLYGNPAEVLLIAEQLARLGRTDVAVVEDAAQAQGASAAGAMVGTVGRFGAFSFYPTKNCGALGDGGAVFARSEADAERVRELRHYGQKDRGLPRHPRALNSRLDELQAAILTVRLGKVSEWNARKARMVQRYRSELGDLPVRFQTVSERCEPAWHLCVMEVESGQVRDRLLRHLERDGVQALVHYPSPNHLGQVGACSLPVTEALSPRILSLPMNAGLREDEQAQVIDSVRRFHGR